MKKITIVLQNLLIISLLCICFILISRFIVNINKEKLDPSYMWNVNFNNVKVTDGSKNADLIVNQNELGLNIVFEEENEFYEFTIDIENLGALNAKITNIELKTESNIDVLKYYLKYDNDEEIKLDDIINSKSKKTIKMRIEYPKQEEKIYEKITLNLKLSISFEAV